MSQAVSPRNLLPRSLASALTPAIATQGELSGSGRDESAKRIVEYFATTEAGHFATATTARRVDIPPGAGDLEDVLETILDEIATDHVWIAEN